MYSILQKAEGVQIEGVTRIIRLHFFSGSFSALANSSNLFVCFLFRFQLFVLFLDTRMVSSSRDAGTAEEQDF